MSRRERVDDLDRSVPAKVAILALYVLASCGIVALAYVVLALLGVG